MELWDPSTYNCFFGGPFCTGEGGAKMSGFLRVKPKGVALNDWVHPSPCNSGPGPSLRRCHPGVLEDHFGAESADENELGVKQSIHFYEGANTNLHRIHWHPGWGFTVYPNDQTQKMKSFPPKKNKRVLAPENTQTISVVTSQRTMNGFPVNSGFLKHIRFKCFTSSSKTNMWLSRRKTHMFW